MLTAGPARGVAARAQKTISTDYSTNSRAAGQRRAAAPRRPPRGREEDGLCHISSGTHRPFPLDWCPMHTGQRVRPTGNVANFIKRAAPGGAGRRRALLRRRSAIRAAGHRASIGCHGTMEAGPVLFLKNVVMRWQQDSKTRFLRLAFL